MYETRIVLTFIQLIDLFIIHQTLINDAYLI